MHEYCILFFQNSTYPVLRRLLAFLDLRQETNNHIILLGQISLWTMQDPNHPSVSYSGVHFVLSTPYQTPLIEQFIAAFLICTLNAPLLDVL